MHLHFIPVFPACKNPSSNCLTSSSTAGEAADFASGNAMVSLNISMNMPIIELPLPLNDDNVSETNEQFSCFITSTVGVRGGAVMLTVVDNDFLSK